jgi:hypothetical protein
VGIKRNGGVETGMWRSEFSRGLKGSLTPENRSKTGFMEKRVLAEPT